MGVHVPDTRKPGFGSGVMPSAASPGGGGGWGLRR